MKVFCLLVRYMTYLRKFIVFLHCIRYFTAGVQIEAMEKLNR